MMSTMISMLTMIFLVALSLTKSPLLLIVWVVMIAFMAGSSMFFLSKWMMLAIIMMYVGGMMILFFYMVSLCHHKKAKINFYPFWVAPTLLAIFYVGNNISLMNYLSGGMINSISSKLLYFMILYLCLLLLTITKLLKLFNSSMKMTFNE